MPVVPSLVGDQVGLFDHDRFRGYALPFASLLRPADSLSTLHPRGYPRWVQDSVLTRGLRVSQVAFPFHWIPPCLLGATPGRAARGGTAPRRRFPPGGHEGTDRRLERPQDPREQMRDDRGTKTYQPVKHVWLSHAARTSRFRSDIDAGRTHDQRRAAATP